MKLRHFPPRSPTARASSSGTPARCCATRSAGSSWRSVLGLETERAVFARYRAARRAEREYL